MEVLLLGTGGPDGCPRPACTCPTCGALRAERTWRAPTAVLVDGALLLGGGPYVAGAAARAGRSLAGLGRVVTLPGRAPGTPSHEPLALPHEVREPSPGVLDVRGPYGGRLLLVAGPLGPGALDATAGAAYDVAVLTLPLDAVAAAVAALRRSGALGPAARVVLAGIDHDGPPPAELGRRAAAWGVEVLPDSSLVGAGAVGPAPPPRPQRTLVLGGARSGKSREAERRLLAEPRVRYVATGGRRDGDAEWGRRVAAHRERRPASWTTLETTDLASVLAEPGPPVLVDCLALWLTAALDAAGAWGGDPAALAAARAQGDAVVAAWAAVNAPCVAVSNEVGSGVVPATASGRLFRDELGRLNTQVAEASDEVLLVVAGQVLRLR